MSSTAENAAAEAPSGALDLVTVIYRPEIPLLRLQARSIKQYFRAHDIGRIYVVVNEMAPEATFSEIAESVLSEYGDLLRKVDIVPMTYLMRPHVSVTGWRTQQSLKLLISRYVQTQHYLILDGKNHFIRPVTRDNFVEGRTRRARSFRLQSHGSLQPYLEASLSYFGLTSADLPGYTLPATTPYVMNTAIVREMIETISEREGKRFDDFFHEPGRNYTEFFLYFAYLLASGRNVEEFYRFGARNTVSLFTRWPVSAEQLSELIGRVANENIVTLGVHKNRFVPEHLDSLGSELASIWLRAGLFDSEQGAKDFYRTTALAVAARPG